MKTFVTFGQVHTHSVNGIILDKDCVAVLNCKDALDGRMQAHKLFGDKFFTTYYGKNFNKDKLKFFPRGLIELN
jgi:hypothetical protein